MTFRRWPRAILAIVLLGLAVVLVVSVNTGSPNKPTAIGTTSALPGLHSNASTGPGSRLGPPGGPPRAESERAKADESDHDVATGSDGGILAGDASRPGAHLAVNPFNFRLGLINGTVVEPDANDWAARTAATGPLLLFLPATGHVPDDYSRFLTVAAESGYHVLGLDFWNRGHAVAAICGVNSSCYTQVQRNRFNGSAPGRFSKVNEANSVVSRLQAALGYLSVHDPDGGWNQFTKDGRIQWADIVVSGHSQGGGEAAYIAHENRVKGQLTFSSPIITDKDIAASWLTTKSKTPTSVMYAFDDIHDEYYARIIHSWRQLHLPGRALLARVPVPTESQAGVHELLSTYDLGNPTESHLRSVTNFTPRDKNGVPVFEPIWKWMLGQVYRDPTSLAATAAAKD